MAKDVDGEKEEEEEEGEDREEIPIRYTRAGFRINPLTGREIKIGGATDLKLRKQRK
jgi:hypothetical protein